MTRFLDVRLLPIGGPLASSVATMQGTQIDNYQSLDSAQLIRDIQGRHVLIATHGFNVSRADGIAALSNWEGLLQLPDPSVFVGLLWPGDSIWAHGLDYPGEPRIADDTGQMIASFIDKYFGGVASVSFASHSLGARVILGTISNLIRPVRRAIIMAGAIDDDCLNAEFQAVAAKVGEISLLASKEDDVLAMAFPLGNLFGGILDQGHPWWHAALGREGPSSPWPDNFQPPFTIPDDWNFGHGNYLQTAPAPSSSPLIPVPADVPPDGFGEPAGGAPGWQQSWTAAFASTRFR